MRRFWHPVGIAEALPRGRAKPLRIMSEDVTLYRGEAGDVHCVSFRCAHRGRQLSTGWVEGDEIRLETESVRSAVGRHELDLEELGPEFSGDQERPIVGIVGDAVQHIGAEPLRG